MAVEEQFYLVWPLILLFLLSMVRNSRLFALVILYTRFNEFQPFLYQGGIWLRSNRPFEDATLDEVMKRLLAHQLSE